MIDDVLNELSVSVTKAHEALKRDLAKLRTGRASAAMLDGIRVDYYGTPTPLAQMANIGVPEARLLTVKPWDKSQVKAVERALRDSDLGLNPQTEADFIRIPIPALSQERRKDLVKIARKNGEETRVAIRKARHEAIDALSEYDDEGSVSTDEADRGKKKVEELVSEGIKHVDAILANKEKEILEV